MLKEYSNIQTRTVWLDFGYDRKTETITLEPYQYKKINFFNATKSEKYIFNYTKNDWYVSAYKTVLDISIRVDKYVPIDFKLGNKVYEIKGEMNPLATANTKEYIFVLGNPSSQTVNVTYTILQSFLVITFEKINEK